MPVLRDHPNGEVLAWCRAGGAGSVASYSFVGKGVANKFLAQQLAHELEDVDTTQKDWSEACFIKVIRVHMSQARGGGG